MAYWTFTKEGRKRAEEIVEEINERGGAAYIGETWMDYGADIFWETIMAESRSKHTYGMIFQLLYPVEFDQINGNTMDEKSMQEIMYRALN